MELIATNAISGWWNGCQCPTFVVLHTLPVVRGLLVTLLLGPIPTMQDMSLVLFIDVFSHQHLEPLPCFERLEELVQNRGQRLPPKLGIVHVFCKSSFRNQAPSHAFFYGARLLRIQSHKKEAPSFTLSGKGARDRSVERARGRTESQTSSSSSQSVSLCLSSDTRMVLSAMRCMIRTKIMPGNTTNQKIGHVWTRTFIHSAASDNATKRRGCSIREVLFAGRLSRELGGPSHVQQHDLSVIDRKQPSHAGRAVLTNLT